MKAVISGATGAIGMALTDRCIREGMEVVVLVRGDSDRIARISDDPRIRVVLCALDEMSSLDVSEDLRDADIFFHLAWAGTSGPSRNDMYLQNKNVEYTLDAVGLASRMGCRAFIGTGSQAEYGRVEGTLTPDTPADPENGYGMAKLCAGYMSRHLCAELDMAHIWTRILSIYGPYDNERSMVISVIRTLLRGETPALTEGRQIWDFLYSGDAADALLRLGLKALSDRQAVDGKVYCIGSGDGRPLREYIEILRDRVDPALSLGFGRIPYGERQVMHLCADISALRADTGFIPVTSFEDGIEKTIDWCRNDPAVKQD